MGSYHFSDRDTGSGAITKDFQLLVMSAQDLTLHVTGLIGASVAHFGFLRWLAVIAAIFLIVIDRTNWKTNFLTALLVPYIGLNLPPLLFNLLRGEIGKWIAFVAVVMQLFFPRHVRDELELPAALVLLLVTLPNLLAIHVRNSIFGVLISMVIGAYLLYQHITAAGGFKKAFAGKRGVPVTIGILLLFVSPIWEVFHFIF
ncbi:hypothetical protein O6H91_10G004800 [Diphasiastrum complanatum]|uniref:Uncharacterized protein n=1 Tax=Diphasiastrum complanatum TaxID=34168 RepID=A0ACC2CDR2_DIPCM|nr:hypothetical protein O6H91_10G004800 [Diphasiastrum complanatum]